MSTNTGNIRVNDDYKSVVTDSGVYQLGEGYERVMMIHTPENRLVKAELRVDRAPEKSFARGHIWIHEKGWEPLVVISPNDFWRDMPGYLRWANDRSDVESFRLSARIFEEILALKIG